MTINNDILVRPFLIRRQIDVEYVNGSLHSIFAMVDPTTRSLVPPFEICQYSPINIGEYRWIIMHTCHTEEMAREYFSIIKEGARRQKKRMYTPLEQRKTWCWCFHMRKRSRSNAIDEDI